MHVNAIKGQHWFGEWIIAYSSPAIICYNTNSKLNIQDQIPIR